MHEGRVANSVGGGVARWVLGTCWAGGWARWAATAYGKRGGGALGGGKGKPNGPSGGALAGGGPWGWDLGSDHLLLWLVAHVLPELVELPELLELLEGGPGIGALAGGGPGEAFPQV